LALLEDLRGGGRFADQDRRKAAMARLYLVTGLDRNFTDEDDKLRDAALDEIRWTLRDADRNWATMGEDDRLNALSLALDIHSDCMGMPPDQWAQITVGGDMTRTLADGTEVILGGRFDHDHDPPSIEINRARMGDFDTIMDTVIHENTHNHQRWLVTQLQQGAIQQTDKIYKQVALFALNQGAGYHRGGNRLLRKKDDDDAYLKQPTELHAHRAGDDTAWVMHENANARVSDMAQRINDWLAANPAHPNATAMRNDQQLMMQLGYMGGTATMLHNAVSGVEKRFSKLTTPASI
jgi:hypothetical protein